MLGREWLIEQESIDSRKGKNVKTLQKGKPSPLGAVRGFTLMEVVLVISIMGALLVWALPALNQSIQNNRTASQSMMMLAMLSFTKSEAVRRSTEVDMVLTLENGAWSAIVEDPTNEADIQGCVPGQLRCSSSENVTLTVASQDDDAESAESGAFGEAAGIEIEPVEIEPEPSAQTFTVTFNNRGYIRGSDDAWEPETFFLQHDDCSGQNQRYRIDITPTGQISSCTLPCNSTRTCQ